VKVVYSWPVENYATISYLCELLYGYTDGY
jgi:hypothetical protein